MVLAALCTLLIPETKGKTIEEIEHGVIYGATMDVHDVVDDDGSLISPDSIHVQTDNGKNARKGETVGFCVSILYLWLTLC